RAPTRKSTSPRRCGQTFAKRSFSRPWRSISSANAASAASPSRWRKNGCVLRARLLTAAIAIPSLLALILYPSPWPGTILVTAVGLIGIGEYALMAFPQQRGERTLTIVLGSLVVLAAAARVPALLSAALATTVTVGLIWTLLARPDFEKGLSDLGLALI